MEDDSGDAEDSADGVAALRLRVLAHLDDLVGNIDLDGSEKLLRAVETGVILCLTEHPLLGHKIDTQCPTVALDKHSRVVLSRCSTCWVNGPIGFFSHGTDLEIDSLDYCHFVVPLLLMGCS